MKLKEGDLAIDFTGINIYGKPVKLSEFRGKKIILSFYRNVSCPFCNRRIHQIMGNAVKLRSKNNLEMIFMFETANEILTKSVFHQGIAPFPLIGDPKKEVYNKYGVENSMLKMMNTFISANPMQAKKDTASFNLPEDKNASMTLIPADFFIDENFKIVKAHYGKHLDDHVSMEDLREFAGI